MGLLVHPAQCFRLCSYLCPGDATHGFACRSAPYVAKAACWDLGSSDLVRNQHEGELILDESFAHSI